MKVMIVGGHGAGKAHNRGAICYNEGDNNYYYSLALKEELERYDGVTVDVGRKNLTDNPTLSQRAAMGEGYDLYIAPHSNAPGEGGPSVRGTEVWDSVEKPNKALAKLICDATATLFNHNNRGVRYKEGQPGFNWYGELRFNKAKSSMIVENGFHTNSLDCQFFKNNHKKIAEVQTAAIASHYKLKKKSVIGFPIISKTKSTINQMKEWAKNKGANQLFIDLAPIFYDISIKSGVNPLVTYCQSAKETGYMKFGGVLNASFNNPCGLKTNKGGGDKDPNAHQRFKNWNEGIQAQVDHLALYAGAIGYPKSNTPDPRHFPFIKGTASTVESLSGKWAPSSAYGVAILDMIKELENTKAPVNGDDDLIDIRLNIFGELVTIKGKNINNTNLMLIGKEYASIREIFESMGFEVTWDQNTKTVVIK